LFEREYHTLAQLAHPAVIQVFDYGVDETGPHYTMEILDGHDLRKLAPVPYRDACAFAYDIASALSLLHSRKLVHRDVTSRNVIITGGRAKLIDFGALLPMGSSEDIVGTPLYIAPEVVLMQAIDGRTDLYSLGVVLYHALTGQFPYRAQTTQDLRAAWQTPTTPVSRLVPGVPAELDRLVSSLMALDRTARPRDAAEVMERLAAAAGLERTEKAAEARAYLVAPTLVGREGPSRRTHELLIRTFRERGGGILVTGPSGVGRSRMLDACVLDARVLGATVLRVGAANAQSGPFAGAQALVEQLEQVAPGVVAAAARFDDGPCSVLFVGEPPAERRLTDLGRLLGRRQEVLLALRQLFHMAAKKQAVVIAVDDLFRLDEPSVALLALLHAEARSHRLSVVVTAPDDVEPKEGSAHLRLLESLERVALEPLDAPAMRTLFRSIFDAVPNVEVVSDRIFDISGGSPRDAITLAEFLIDRGVIQYRAGGWVLPADIDRSLLPDGMAGALRQRLAALSPLALRLARAHALSARGSIHLPDFMRLGRETGTGEVHFALDELVAADVFLTDGSAYALRHEGWRVVLTAGLGPEEQRQHHAELARMHELGDAEPLGLAYHLLLAGSEARALDILERFAQGFVGQAVDVFATTELGPTELGQTFEHAIEACRRLGRGRKFHGRLRHFIMAMGVFVDAAWFLNSVPEVTALLKKESGYLIWESLDPGMEPMPRLFAALARAQADYDAAAEDDRLYPPRDAIRHLVQYVVGSVGVGARTADKDLHRSLPALLVPFAPLSPVVAAILENTRAIVDVSYARNESSRPRYLAVIEQLSSVDAASLQHAEEIRDALIYGLGVAEMRLGLTSATAFMDRIESNPRHRSTALTVRSILCLQQGDWATARDLKRQAELFDMESDTKQIFGHSNLRNEIEIFALGADLGAVKRIMETLNQLARRYPGWLALAHTARAEFERLRGNLEAALEEFDRCIELSEPTSFDDCPDGAWYPAGAGKMEVLLALGRALDAKAWGERALRFSGGHPTGTRYHGISRALALAEAKLGEHAKARSRLATLIGERLELGTTGVFLGVLYEAAAYVGLFAGDAGEFQRFAGLAAGEFLKFPTSGFSGRYETLLEAARSVVSVAGAESSLHASLAVRGREEATTLVARTMQSLVHSQQRAERGLALLCERSQAAGGYLYLLRGSALALVASREEGPPDPQLDVMLAAWLDAAVDDPLDEALETQVVDSDSTLADGPNARWKSPEGRSYHLVAIRTSFGGESSKVGVAALRYEGSTGSPLAIADLANALGEYFLQTGSVTASPLKIDAS
jgi:tetratricopeptide (TPR) repeat protein